VAFVTGAAHGIGRATAIRLAREGASVAVADRDTDAANSTMQTIADAGGSALSIACDVTDTSSVDAAIAEATDRLGGIDILANVAGADIDEPVFHEQPDDIWLQMVQVNLMNVVRCTRAALPHLLRSTNGPSVTNVSSVNGMMAIGSVPYSAAKAAIQNLTMNLAAQYGPQGVRVNAVAPGTVRTRVWDSQPGQLERMRLLYPLGRVGEPEDIAAAIAFLSSDDAAWITGVLLPVDGGLTGSRPVVVVPPETE
jgi:NAD(P)-dependent dehydrogenase (short-subunit alcohol dehydrogenase family)